MKKTFYVLFLEQLYLQRPAKNEITVARKTESFLNENGFKVSVSKGPKTSNTVGSLNTATGLYALFQYYSDACRNICSSCFLKIC